MRFKQLALDGAALAIIGTLMSPAGALAQKTREAGVRAEIEQLNIECGWYLDHAMFDAFAGCFTTEARLGVTGGQPIVGRPAIRARYGAMPAGRTVRHFAGPVHLTWEDARHVRGLRSVSIYASDVPAPRPPISPTIMDYQELYERGADGKWRYAERIVTPVFGGP